MMKKIPDVMLKSGLCTLAATIMFALTGCAAPRSTSVSPIFPVPDEYAQHEKLPGGKLTRWRDYFTDPVLQRLIEQALENNRDLRIAMLRVEEARAAYDIQSAEQLPTIGLQAGAARSRTPADLNLTQHRLISSQYQTGIGMASWELDFWGRVRSLSESALQTYLATDEAQRAGRLALIAQVADSYLELAELNQRIALARRTIASREESYRIFSRRVALGATSRLNLTQIQTLLTQAQALGSQLEQLRETRLHALSLLVGGAVPTAVAENQLQLTTTLGVLDAGLPSELLSRRPDILAAEHRLKAASANVAAARAAFFPQITLTGSYGTASAELNGLFASGSHAWQFAPSMTLPLFDHGRLKNNLDLNEVRRDVAVATYEKTVQLAFRDVSDALTARYWLYKQVEIAKAALAAQSERARLSQLRYDSGAAAFLDVLDAQRDLLTAEQQLVQLHRAYLSSSVNLYAALGGVATDLPSPVSVLHLQ
ncbi:efflux transporter outer membrane subunit [Undibacterium sp. SXout7W]|uniref:efflux transporter outer membrane subunit n=1 Tax=Undibacterium sp. SXout7W TaxID=3413049 RepID=UPI003BF21274